MKKRVLSLLLCFVLAAGLLSVCAPPAQAGTIAGAFEQFIKQPGQIKKLFGNEVAHGDCGPAGDEASVHYKIYEVTNPTVVQDNPFLQQAGASPEIWSYGHRNVQGAALHPATGELWAHEHGPQGGDELNRVLPGRNYGWPVITFGREYVIGSKIGEGTARADVEAPLTQWTPSIAPSGMAFYTAESL